MKIFAMLGIGAIAVFALCRAEGQQVKFDPEAILRELDKLEEAHRERVAVESKSAGDGLRQALANPRALLDLYEEAVFATRFEGGRKDSIEFRKWKTAQQSTHKDEDFQAALQIHAQYLNLTLFRASGFDVAKLNEALVQHARLIWQMENRVDLGKKVCAELLRRPVNQGVLAQHFGLGSKIGGPQGDGKVPDRDKTWEWLPGNTDGMLDRTVFPFLREVRGAGLIVLWDERIANEAARAKRTGLSDRAARFGQQTLPKLLWQRSRDLVHLGRREEGLLAMLEILRKSVNHNDFAQNVKELRGLLTGAAVTVTEPVD